MPNDYLTLKALTCELSEALVGGKIEKIYQPEKDELTLFIHTRQGRVNLVVSCNAQAPRINISTIKKENPINAPTFCMHMRKLLSNGLVEDVSLINNDRIICLKIISKNELKDTVNYRLIFEMMGRYSNIILINEKSIILDAVKQVPFDTATKRCLLPGMAYTCPEQAKLAPQDYDGLTAILTSYRGGNLAKFITAHLSGLSLESATEIAAITQDKIESECDVIKVVDKLKSYYDIQKESNYKPCVSVNKENEAQDYFITPYTCLGYDYQICDSLSQAIERCLSKRDESERHRERSKHLYSALKKYIARNEKKLQKAKEKLMECDKMETVKKYGELITCNLHFIQKNAESVTVTDYYDEAMPEITIPLNKQFTPSQCAQDYFKRYNKLKRTLAVINDQITNTENDLDYAKSIASMLSISSSIAELYQIEEELYSIGAIKKLKNSLPKTVKKAEPFSYEYKDFAIMVGKNNYQNNNLTFKTANGGDMWLHTLNYHGSHVVIFAESREIPDDVVEFACELAGYYSGGAENDKVAVDYTFRKFVKRNPSGNIGMVTYTNQQTAYIKPNAHEEFKLK